MVTAAVAKNLAEGPERARQSQRRRRAVRSLMAGAPVPQDIPPGELGAAAARIASREALAVARAQFDDSLGRNAEAVAAKLVEMALGGNVPAMLVVARTIVPPAKFDNSKINLDVGALETAADLDRARRRLAAATFAGQVGIEDAGHLVRMLDSLSEAAARDEQTKLVADMRLAIQQAATGGITTKIAMLSQRAELVLRTLADPETPQFVDIVPTEESETCECLL